MSQGHRYLQFLSIIIILTLLFSGHQPPSVSAQGRDGLKRQINPQTGKVSFISPESGPVLSAAQALGTGAAVRPQDPAMALAKRFASEFGVNDPERDLKELRANHSEAGRLTVRYQQNYQGIPVLGGELIINTNENGDLYSISGEGSSNLALLPQPTIDSQTAKETAIRAAAQWHQTTPEKLLASEPQLWIFDESLLRPSTRPVELVWRMEVTSVEHASPVRELVLVNAQEGNISLHFNQIDMSWEMTETAALIQPARGSPLSRTREAAQGILENSFPLVFSPLVSTYTAGNGTTLPGTFVCNQADPNCSAGDAHAKAAHKFAIGTYNLYATQHGRDSLDNHGMIIVSTVHYDSNYTEALWDGRQIIYGDGNGYPFADDIVAHEYTHGVTQYESGLFYYYQSGAINESFSDLWGEYYDQTNGQGTDTAGVKWLIGEDVSGRGPNRSMINPPVFGDPDKMSSPNYYEGESDYGGVHTNSGINNKAVFLMVDGGNFNGKTITALGWSKTTAIYYEVNSNLLVTGADYSDLYYALQQACRNLIGQKGITAGDCVEVKDAIDAVEMNSQPSSGFNSDAPLCTEGDAPNILFVDDLEAGIANWTFNNGAYPRWQLDSPYGVYAPSGAHSLYAADEPATVTDATARWVPLTVPNNAYLHFTQAYAFETSNQYDDGGVLEYSINNGSTWSDAGPLIDYNGYEGRISSGTGNPLAGRSAFVGSSHGYISTRLNLASLAGRTVTFRWRIGLNQATSAGGWWVDNIKIYTCSTFSDVPSTHMFHRHIEAFYNAGITAGCSQTPRNYCPNAPVTRGEMAVFIERAMGNFSPNPSPNGMFTDVQAGNPFKSFIEEFYNDGITSGCTLSPLQYCPLNNVTRGEMAVFIERAMGNFSPNPNPTDMFTDVLPGNPFKSFIEEFYNDGITSGCSQSPLQYCPEHNVTRGEMAVFIVRAFDIPLP